MRKESSPQPVLELATRNPAETSCSQVLLATDWAAEEQIIAVQVGASRSTNRKTTQSRLLTTLGRKPLENIVGKGENAGNQHFLLFPQCFLPDQ